MKARRVATLAVLTLAMQQFPGLASADIFKCSVNGQTVYQDQPCAGTAAEAPYKKTEPVIDPGLSVPAYQPRHSTPGSTRLASLHQDIRDASNYYQQLQRLYDADVKMLRLRVAQLSRPEQQRAVEALKAKWQPELQAASRRQQSLMDELRLLCPHGAMLNAHTQRCSR